jgi:hypothetical protein
MNLVTAADDRCQNGRKFMCGWSTSAKLYLYRTEKNTQAGKIIAEPVACKWCVEVAHPILILHDTWSNNQRATRRGGWNPTWKPHIPTLQLHTAHQLIQHDGGGRIRAIFFPTGFVNKQKFLVEVQHKSKTTIRMITAQSERAVFRPGVRPTAGSELYCFQDTYSCVLTVSAEHYAQRLPMFFFYVFLTVQICIIF